MQPAATSMTTSRSEDSRNGRMRFKALSPSVDPNGTTVGVADIPLFAALASSPAAQPMVTHVHPRELHEEAHELCWEE